MTAHIPRGGGSRRTQLIQVMLWVCADLAGRAEGERVIADLDLNNVSSASMDKLEKAAKLLRSRVEVIGGVDAGLVEYLDILIRQYVAEKTSTLKVRNGNFFIAVTEPDDSHPPRDPDLTIVTEPTNAPGANAGGVRRLYRDRFAPHFNVQQLIRDAVGKEAFEARLQKAKIEDLDAWLSTSRDYDAHRVLKFLVAGDPELSAEACARFDDGRFIAHGNAVREGK